MSRRNPITGKRAPPEPGRAIRYVLPAGPPAQAVEAFGGDAQAAITVGLTLLYLALRGAPLVPGVVPTGGGDRKVEQTLPDPLRQVVAQDFFGG